jgi:uncharacterized protein with HEPN domain
MSPKPEYDLLHLLRMLEAIEKINLYSASYTDPMAFFEANDQKEFNACLNLLAQIGEITNKISQQTKAQNSSVDWEKLYGYRNRVVHDYTGIDKFITFDIIKSAIPDTSEKITSAILNGIADQTFAMADFELAKSSPYLKHVDFTKFR